MNEINYSRRDDLFNLIEKHLDKAYNKHGAEPWSRHEFYGILLEEIEEVWEAIKLDQPQEEVLKEIVDAAVVLFRYFETPDRYRGDQPSIG